MIFILVEPSRTPLFGGLKVSVLATCRLCFMYNCTTWQKSVNVSEMDHISQLPVFSPQVLNCAST